MDGIGFLDFELGLDWAGRLTRSLSEARDREGERERGKGRLERKRKEQ